MASGPLQELSELGVAIWLDDLSRPRVLSGDLARLMASRSVVGVTTNPTIFAKALSSGSGYEEQVRDLALRGTAVGEAVRLLTAWDVRAACDVLRPAYDASAGLDGRVSIEVDPRISGDHERTAAEARGLWWLVDRPNLFIKIPATLAGLPAITATIAAGISVNVTLIFSVERYRAVLEAFQAGLEQRRDTGEPLSGVESVASFFVSRIDVEIDKQLDALAERTPARAVEFKRVRGQAAIANARLAYEVWEEMLATPRWRALQSAGARPQRLLWASTGVKDKAYDDTRYVVDLAAPRTVNTMPAGTLEAVADHGHPRGDAVTGTYDAARDVFDKLRDAGVNFDAVVEQLEVQGIKLFEQSWDELIQSVTQQLERAGADVMPAGAVKPASGDGSSSAPTAAAPRKTAG